MQALLIVFYSVLACVLYGVIHDQFTTRICLEYFTVGHAPLFATQDPTLLAFCWGFVATWWVGLFLGVPLAVFARAGSRPPRSANSLLKPMAVLMGCTAFAAATAGVIAYFAAGRGWIALPPAMAGRLPPETHTPFLVDWIIHNTSYTAGFVGGLFLMAWVWWTRIRMQQASRG
jgi:hypothetical protein